MTARWMTPTGPDGCMNCGTVRHTGGGYVSCDDRLGASCTPTGPDGDPVRGYRLTLDDEHRMMVALGESIHAHGNRDTGALARVAAHAVGCSLYDLRTVELEWIDAAIAHYLDPCPQPCTYGAWGDRCALPAGHPGDHHRDHAAHTRTMP